MLKTLTKLLNEIFKCREITFITVYSVHLNHLTNFPKVT